MALVRFTSRGGVFHGWYIVAVAFVANATSGIGSYSFGLFFEPMGGSLGWSRTAISWALTIRAIVNMAAGPVLGPLLDRKHGPQLIMTLGGVLIGVSLMLTAGVNHLWQFYLLFGVGYGLSSAAMSAEMITPTLVSKWFIRLRGRAVALSVAGTSFGGVIFIPLASYVIINIGWREAWIALGFVALFLVVVPSALFVRRTPEDVGLWPDGDVHGKWAASGGVARFATDREWTLGEAVRTRTLWLLVVTFSIGTAGLGGFIAHAIPYMTDSGYSDGQAAATLVVFSLTAASIKPVWGLIGERLEARYLLAIAFAISSAGMMALATLNGGPWMGIALIGYAFGAGAFLPLTNLVWANYYGRTSLGAIRGVFQPPTQLVMAVSPVYSGYIFDRYGTYDAAFLSFGILFALGMVAILFAKRPDAAT